MIRSTRLFAAACSIASAGTAMAQQAAPSNGAESHEAAPSSSLLVTTPVVQNPHNDKDYEPHALRDVSLFAIAPPEPREFVVHDLVQIIVRETSTAKSSQDLETKKESTYDGEITDWPMYGWADFVYGGPNAELPGVGVEFTKDFKGEGDYARKDDLSARITAEVIEVLPNGNLVLEARTFIKTDKEEQTMSVTGICRPDDITPLNTINSNQIHDLTVQKVHTGAIKEAADKGLFTQVLDFIFAF
jgi:flagellar L-ring protein precursor FlgH